MHVSERGLGILRSPPRAVGGRSGWGSPRTGPTPARRRRQTFPKGGGLAYGAAGGVQFVTASGWPVAEGERAVVVVD